MNQNNSHTQGKSWRLILVGYHGSIVPLGSVKIVLFVLITSFILISAGACVFGFLYIQKKSNYSNLIEDLDQKNVQLQTLRDERDILMARLVITESKLNSDADSKKSISQKSSSDLKESKTESGSNAQLEKKPDASFDNPQQNEPAPVSVDISDLKVKHDTEIDTIAASYTLKNTTKGNVQVSGRCLMVLKGSINQEATNYPIPNVPLENGIPSAKYGHRFAIRNFLNVKLNRSAPNQSFIFNHGIVYIFDSAGKVLLKREVPLNLSYAEAIAPTQTDTSSKNSKDSDTMTDIKDDTPARMEPQNQADQRKVSE
jgi:hypothetical protein